MKMCTLANRIVKGFVFLLLLTGLSFTGHAQMKIGNHPTSIQPASILELESSNQALRLTQGDTAKINTIIGTETTQNGASPTTAAEGMIMYQVSDSSLYMRIHGWWHKIMSANQVNNQYFKLGGNRVTTTNTFLGLMNADSLTIGTDSLASIVIMPNGIINMLDSLHAVLARVDSLYSGVASIGTLNVNDSLNVAGKLLVNADSSKAMNVFIMQDSIIMRNLNNARGKDTALLSIGPKGHVHKMSLDSLFQSNKTTINGIKSNVFHLKFDTVSVGHTGPWIDSTSMAADSVLIFNIPNASLTVRGLMSDSAQAFAGNKSFSDSVAIGTSNAPGAALDVHGNVNLATVMVTSNYDLTSAASDTIKTIIADVSSVPSGTAIAITLPTITSAMNGRVYTIKKVGKTDDNQLGSPVEIDPSGSQTFGDGGTTFKIYNNFTSVTIQASGTKWYIVGH